MSRCGNGGTELGNVALCSCKEKSSSGMSRLSLRNLVVDTSC